jgi:hypothetical protein
MNPFFLAHGDVPFQVPGAAFVRFEQSDIWDEEQEGEGLFVFTGVSADWLESRTEAIYGLSEPDALRSHWEQYWQRLFRQMGRGKPGDLPPDPYWSMPFLRYEITRKSFQKRFGDFVELAGDEWSWLRIERDPKSPIRADVYGNAFGNPQQVSVKITPVSERTMQALSAMFDMGAWPDGTRDDISAALDAVARHAAAVVAFDIGQGSASALLDGKQAPFIYHDLGAGITGNARTTPIPLKFCWTNRPVVVLSHWDMDHWAGALKDHDAMTRTWIVPRQVLSVGHAAFGSAILHAGGSVLVWPNGLGSVVQQLGYRQEMTVDQGTGRDRNGSGLVIRVDDENHGELRHWLLTGDAGYDQLPFACLGRMVAMTVPHHGAKMRVNRAVPRGPGGGYGRLLYSFGPGNRHGRTRIQHPTAASVAEHQSAGWTIGTWGSASQPGSTVAGGQVLATAQHSSSHLGGVVAGWDTPPAALSRPCWGSVGGPTCSTEIKQS